MTISSLNVTIPVDAIVIASATVAPPMVPASGIATLTAEVTAEELTVTLAVPPVEIAT